MTTASQKTSTKVKPFATVTMQVDIPLLRIADLVSAGIEAGSSATFMVAGYKKPPLVTFRYYEKELIKHLDYPLNEGGAVLLVVRSDDDHAKQYPLTLESMKAGLAAFQEKAPQQFKAFMEENEDALTGDCFLQCCLLGEVVYG
jgi:hypothetical protein